MPAMQKWQDKRTAALESKGCSLASGGERGREEQALSVSRSAC